MLQLPIEPVIPTLLSHIKSNQQVILKAQPGAGKSTYLPLQLIKQKAVEGKIVMLEPRRLAARNIATYLAKQLGEKVGEQVGFRVRGETRVSHSIKLEVVTEGIMTRMLQSDPELTGVDLLIFDEFHERSIHADTSLAFALEIQEALRDDLKILVMSATLEQSSLTRLLPNASYVESKGRSYPIEYQYSPIRVNERLIPCVTKAIHKVLHQEMGSVLVFLPSASAIKQVEAALDQLPDNTHVYPLYGRLSYSEQQQAIAACSGGERKIVLATNIAETSLTIEGIRVVIDSGLERVASFDLKNGVTKLEEVKIAQSSAIQRAGRAGRIESGVCVRLYSEEQLKQFSTVPEPEILHSDLSSLCIELIQWGSAEANSLKWLDTPLPSHMKQGFQLLESLGLTSDTKQLTRIGQQAQKLAIEPRLAALILKSLDTNKDFLATAIALVAIIEESCNVHFDITHSLYALKQRSHHSQYSIEKRAKALAFKLNETFAPHGIDEEAAGICLAFAYPDRLAQRRKGSTGQFTMANGHGATVDELEPLSNADYLVIVDLMRSKQDSSRVFCASGIDIDQLNNANPDIFSEVESIEWNENKGQLVAEKQIKLGKLIVSRKTLPTPDEEKMTLAILGYIRRKGLSILNWNSAAISLLNRIRCAALWLENEKWPDVSDDALLDNLEVWLKPYMLGKVNVKSLARIDLSQALLAYIGWPLNQQIDEWLPASYQLPTGSRKTIQYHPGSDPMVSVRMQEVFGEKSSPSVAKGKKKIVLELLSPAHRPLQVTADLERFWAGSYKEIQKEMKGRYPKHPWPDDPANHIATTKTKRQLKS